VRRCGKSTLVAQFLKSKYADALFLNFEDSKMYDFEQNDFLRLGEIIQERQAQTLVFDEIQVVKGWEVFIRQKLEEGYKVVITGSNASLLSRELGTKLTGRHITRELFPFSFAEFCKYRRLKPDNHSAEEYLKNGGFPEYLKEYDTEVLTNLFDDILLRDIIVRYNIGDARLIRRLAGYLIANVGNLLTGNKLKTYFDIKSTSTILEYLSYMEDAYLFFLVPKFSYSMKKQMINPRKLYAVDTGMITRNSIGFSESLGQIFENLVFLHYRRKYREIYYFSEKGECDFVVCSRGKALEAVQVCYELNPDNLQREIDGLAEAMNFFELKEGKIITLRQKDCFSLDGKTVTVVPLSCLSHDDPAY